METFKCPNCGEFVLVADNVETLECICGKKYKNPYFDRMTSKNTAPNSDKNEILTKLITIRTSIYGIHNETVKIEKPSWGIGHYRRAISEQKAEKKKELPKWRRVRYPMRHV